MKIKTTYFNIHQIADSGQAFRWYPHKEGYLVVANHDVVYITQENDIITLTPMLEKLSDNWQNYLSLDEDYGSVVNALIGKDGYLDKAITFGSGIRILKQEPFEMVVTFIISANNNIKRITSAVQMLSQNYGDYLCTIDGITYHDFPTAKQLKEVTIETYRSLGLGYRDRYLFSLIHDISNGYDLEVLKSYEDAELKKALLRLKGIGEKVANCVLLFGYDRKEGFPIDTWIKKVLLANYDVKESNLQTFAESYFQPHGGIAQQYLFYYGRFN